MTISGLNIHTLPDLSGWRVIEVWTIEEAAMIWAGLDPIDHQVDDLDKIKGLVSERQYKKSWIARRAFVEAISQGTLPFVNAYEWNSSGYDCWAEEVIFPNLPDANRTITNRTRIAQAALLKWAKGKYPTLREDLKKEHAIQQAPQKTTGTPMLINGYTNKSIELMAIHIEQNIAGVPDEKMPSATEQKKWLRGQAGRHGLSQNDVDAIYTVARPEVIRQKAKGGKVG
jgi:hypothetical protein